MRTTFAVYPNAPAFPTELDELFLSAQRRTQSTFRVALLIPMCGSAGIWGPSCISSAQVAAEELNRGDGIGGRKVHLIMIDAAVEAEVPVEETVSELIETQSIDAIVGMHISAVRQRLSKVVCQRIPYIYTPLYEGGERTAGLFAIGETPSEQLGPSMEMIQNRYRVRSWALIGNDYVWPRISHVFAKAKLHEMSAGLAYERYVPFGLQNMGRYVEEIDKSGAEAVLVSLVGHDAVVFNRAFGVAGLHRRVVRLSCALEENGLLACGASNSERMYAAASYFASLPTEANAAFKERYHAMHGDQAPVLNSLGQSTYEGVHFLAGLMQRHPDAWRQHGASEQLPIFHKSGRKHCSINRRERPIYLARADGLRLEVIDEI